MRDAVIKWAIGTILAVGSIGLLYAGDSHYVTGARYVSDQNEQILRDNRAEIRNLDSRILDIESELEYGNVSSERRAILENQLKLLESQKESIMLEIQT